MLTCAALLLPKEKLLNSFNRQHSYVDATNIVAKTTRNRNITYFVSW